MYAVSELPLYIEWVKNGLKAEQLRLCEQVRRVEKKKQQQEKTNKQKKNPQGSRTMAGWSDKSERKEGDFRGVGSTGRGMMSREME